ncbi:hypothetical protein PCE1_002356 [Barthelona sp. PCE]
MPGRKRKAAETKKELRQKLQTKLDDDSDSEEEEELIEQVTVTKEEVEIVVTEEVETEKLKKGGRTKKEDPIIPPADPRLTERLEQFNWDEYFHRETYWTTLSHNGILFQPDYVPHDIPVVYNGVDVEMSPEMEEIATFWAQTMHLVHVTKPKFRENFFNDWQRSFPEECVIEDLDGCDFTRIKAHLDEQRERRKKRTRDEKRVEKEEKASLKERFGYAVVDNEKQEIANYQTEIPGLFRGRGDHPKAGKVKRRVVPEDVTLNLDEDAEIPPAPEGHEWKEIIHNPSAQWLAKWACPITGNIKYVKLKATSLWKTDSDIGKFETARRLRPFMNTLRYRIQALMKSDDETLQQIGVCAYMIDNFAFRPGSDKNKDEEADTVGITSIKRCHVKLTTRAPDRSNEEDDIREWLCEAEANVKGGYIVFDFLGKDSVPYQRTHKIGKTPYRIIRSILKKPGYSDANLFSIGASDLNKWLSGQLDGLTAKVLRTYNASVTLDMELHKPIPEEFNDSEAMKVQYFKTCNKRVAVLCNHQRQIAANHDEMLNKREQKIKEFEEEMEVLNDRLRRRQADEPVSDDEYHFKKLTAAQKRKLKIEEDAEHPKMEEFMEENAEDIEENPKAMVNTLVVDEKNALHMWQLIKHQSLKQTQNSIERAVKKIEKEKILIEEKVKMKNVSLTTSLTNYIDPRIVVAWCKREQVHLKKVYSNLLRQKFEWSFDVPQDFVF